MPSISDPDWAPAESSFASPFWHLGVLGIPEAWKRTRGEGVTIAIVDGGVDTLPGLTGKRVSCMTQTGMPDKGGDRARGHGTACASLAASSSKWAPGVAPRAHVLSVNVAGADGRPLLSKVEKGLALAAQHADIISCSFVMPTSSALLESVIRTAHNDGRIIIGAAGNVAAEPTAFPERTLNVVTVAPVSKQGKPLKGVRTGKWIDVAAPGEDLMVLTRNGPRTWNGLSSGATAIVAGVCALILSVAKKAGNAPQVAKALPGLIESTAADVMPPGADPFTGRGIISPLKLLAALSSHP